MKLGYENFRMLRYEKVGRIGMIVLFNNNNNKIRFIYKFKERVNC